MNSQAIEDLNSLLKNELSAIENYQHVLSNIKEKAAKKVLEDNCHSHWQRSEKLRDLITRLGGEPATGTGAGGQVAKLIMGGAEAMGDTAMIVALQTDEGEWTANYEWRLVSMHGDHRPLVKEDLFPQQQITEEKVRELAHVATNGLWAATPGTKDI